MQGVVSEVFFYHVPFVSAADNKVIYSKVGVEFHNMPQYRIAAYLYHWFRLYHSFF